MDIQRSFLALKLSNNTAKNK